MLQFVSPRQGQFWLQGIHMNILSRGPLGHATYQISNLYAFQVQRKRILKFSFFVHVFQFCDIWVGPDLNLGVSYEQT